MQERRYRPGIVRDGGLEWIAPGARETWAGSSRPEGEHRQRTVAVVRDDQRAILHQPVNRAVIVQRGERVGGAKRHADRVHRRFSADFVESLAERDARDSLGDDQVPPVPLHDREHLRQVLVVQRNGRLEGCPVGRRHFDDQDFALVLAVDAEPSLSRSERLGDPVALVQHGTGAELLRSFCGHFEPSVALPPGKIYTARRVGSIRSPR